MDNTRSQRIVNNFSFGMAFKVFSLLMPFVIRTIIIRTIGIEYLGLSSLFTSVLQMLNLTELGFSSAVVFFLYAPLREKNEKHIASIINYYRHIYKCVGAVILIVGLILLPWIGKFISGDVPNDVNIYVLYLIYLLNTVISYIAFGYRKAILEADNHNDTLSRISIIVYFLMYLCQIIVLVSVHNYYCYILFLPISTIVENIFVYTVVEKRYPFIRINKNEQIDKADMHKINKMVGSLFLYKVGGAVSNSFDNIVISSFLGLSTLAIYGNYYYVISALFGILQIFYSSIRASIGEINAEGNTIQLRGTFDSLFSLQQTIIGVFTICLISLYQDFIEIWIGTQYQFSDLTVLLMGIYFYTWKIQDIVHIYKESCGLWNKDRYRPLVASLVNLSLNLTLVNYWGINAVILSTIISEIFVNYYWASNVLFKSKFKKNTLGYIYDTFLGIVITCAILFLCLKIFDSWKISGYIDFFVKSMIIFCSSFLLYVSCSCLISKKYRKMFLYVVEKIGQMWNHPTK